MRQFLDSCRQVVLSFLLSFVKAFAPGKEWIYKICPLIFWVIGSLPTLRFISEKVHIRFDGFGDLPVSIAIVVPIFLLAAWVCIAIGFAFAKTNLVRIELPETMEFSELDTVIRLVINVVGFGQVHATASVADFLDANGERFMFESVRGLNLEWTHHWEVAEMVTRSGDVPQSFSVFGFYPNPGRWKIYGIHHRPEFDQASDPRRNKLWIKIRVDAKECRSVEKWYAIEKIDNPGRIIYHPCCIPSPMPDFCK